MKTIALATIALAAIMPPRPRQTPEKIDISKKPALELVAANDVHILVETGDNGQMIEIFSSGRKIVRTMSLNWNKAKTIEVEMAREGEIVKLIDSDGDGLPEIRVFFEVQNGQLVAKKSERLLWRSEAIEVR
jgi:hypothetical protein